MQQYKCSHTLIDNLKLRYNFLKSNKWRIQSAVTDIHMLYRYRYIYNNLSYMYPTILPALSLDPNISSLAVERRILKWIAPSRQVGSIFHVIMTKTPITLHTLWGRMITLSPTAKLLMSSAIIISFSHNTNDFFRSGRLI